MGQGWAANSGWRAAAGLADYAQWAFGSVLVLLGLLTLYFLPGPSEVFLILAVALVALLLRRFEAWLLLLPATLPTLDLGLWNGRLFYNEMDALALIILGCFLLSQRRAAIRSVGWPPAVFIAFVAIAVIGGAVAIAAKPEFTSNTPYDYLSPFNAVRVIRPMIWALLLWWPLALLWKNDPKRCGSLLLTGISLGLIGFGLIVLWERGVFLAVFTSFNPYAILGALLDTSTTYRVTGLFAEMHTGGTTVDAYLSLAVPLACVGAIVQPNWRLRLLCFVALMLGLYAAMATFSRGLYLGLGVSLAYFFFVFVRKVEEQIGLSNRTKAIILLSMVAFVFVAFFSFNKGGYMALGYALLCFFAIVGLRYACHGVLRKAFLPAAVAIGALAFVLLQATFAESRYSPLASSQATYAAALFVLLIVGTAVPLAIALRPILPPLYVFPAMALVAVVCVVSMPSLGGFRMEERFATSEEDLSGRLDHWSTAYGFLGSSPLSYVIGIGTGAYPRYYFWSDRRREDRVSYTFMNEGGKSFLRYSGGDFTMMQKVSVQPNSPYRIELTVRGLSPNGSVAVLVCPKVVLFFQRHQPGCRGGRQSIEQEGAWQRLVFELNSGDNGADWPLRHPPTLLINSRGLVDITDLRLFNAWDNALQNGDFAEAGDHWLMASDYNHLSWHIKNVFLHVLVENGILGLAAFVAALGVAIVRLNRARASQSLLANGLIASLISFSLVGVFGTLIDNTRPALLFYLILLWALSFRLAGDAPSGQRADAPA